MDPYTQSNLDNWNERTPVHARSKFYDVEGFKKGRSTLKHLETEELGEVRGQSLLHLQCHFGLDTLSWARAGAVVTGVDFSDNAIELARSLSHETGLQARFICSDIYQLPDVLKETFDMVFASYGVLCWISDVPRWMNVASAYLKPGGTLYLIDDHPMAGIFGTDLNIEDPYFHHEQPISCTPQGTYADRSAAISATTYQWVHSLSDIVNAAIHAGLQLEFVHEFPFCAWERFPGHMKEEKGWHTMKDPKIEIPLLFSIKAHKT